MRWYYARVLDSKNGEEISIKDMTNAHIINTIEMLDRNISRLGNIIEMHGEIHEHITLDHIITRQRIYNKKQELKQEILMRASEWVSNDNNVD